MLGVPDIEVERRRLPRAVPRAVWILDVFAATAEDLRRVALRRNILGADGWKLDARRLARPVDEPPDPADLGRDVMFRATTIQASGPGSTPTVERRRPFQSCSTRRRAGQRVSTNWSTPVNRRQPLRAETASGVPGAELVKSTVACSWCAAARLPDCSGVAIGVDRPTMSAGSATSLDIDEVLALAGRWQRC